MNANELRKRVGAARRVILEPARVAADAAKQEIMREVLRAAGKRTWTAAQTQQE